MCTLDVVGDTARERSESTWQTVAEQQALEIARLAAIIVALESQLLERQLE